MITNEERDREKLLDFALMIREKVDKLEKISVDLIMGYNVLIKKDES